MTSLLLTGGRGHPASATAPALSAILGDVDVHDDMTQGLQAVAERRHDLLVVNALAFTMTDSRYSDADRDTWAFHLDTAGREALAGWVAHRRPLLALHTALVSFDDWPGWRDIIGGAWEWGVSHHGPIGPFTVSSRLGDGRCFEVVDELYEGLWLAPGVEVVASSGSTPVAWRHQFNGARVATCALGHDASSLETAGHAALLGALVRWLAGEEGTNSG